VGDSHHFEQGERKVILMRALHRSGIASMMRVEVCDKISRTHTGNAGHFIIGGVADNNTVNAAFGCGQILNRVFKIFSAESQSVGDSCLRNRSNRKKIGEFVHNPVGLITVIPGFSQHIENSGHGSSGQTSADMPLICQLKNYRRMVVKGERCRITSKTTLVSTNTFI
jgi:hypothetical protein